MSSLKATLLNKERQPKRPVFLKMTASEWYEIVAKLESGAHIPGLCLTRDDYGDVAIGLIADGVIGLRLRRPGS